MTADKAGQSAPPAEAEMVSFLRQALAADGPVELIETHAARVFLAGERALKVKKPVKLAFLDFSTLAARQKALERELELNRPHAPEIYLRLVPVTREADGRLSLGGAGSPAEWALEMRRFDEADLLSALADRGPLRRALCQALALMAARYHEGAPAAGGIDAAAATAATLGNLVRALNKSAAAIGPETVGRLRRNTEAAVARFGDLMRARTVAGAVRRCHGDLHLGNIVLIGGRPVPFDALEFDEKLATIDVLYDLAFLLMDLSVRGDRSAANVVLNAYVGAAPLGNEIEGLGLMPLFLAMRAAVRAVVALARAGEQVGTDKVASTDDAARLTDFAAGFIDPPPASLIAVGGFSGTGKSTLAAALAPYIGAAPGALHIRSDVERKRLFGVAETERLAPEHYTPAVTQEVYRILFNKAERALLQGHAVVLDAVSSLPEEREAIAAIAARAGVPFVGLWLEAPMDVLVERVTARRGDASDADAAVVRTQLSRKIGALDWTRVDAREGAHETRERALAVLRAAEIALSS